MLGTPKRRGGKAWVLLLSGLLVGGLIGAGGMYLIKRGKSGIPGGPRLGEAKELAMVPTDASGFIHIRARDIWKSEYLDQFRKAVDKAGPDSLKILDEGFVPAPSSLDRMTVVFLRSADSDPIQPKAFPKGAQPKGIPPKGGVPPVPKGGPGMLPGGLNLPFDTPNTSDFASAVVILAFREPFDAAKIRSTYMPEGTQRVIDGKEMWMDKVSDGSRDLGIYFSGDTVMVIGPVSGMEQFVGKQRDTQPVGPLSAAIKTAAEGGRHIVAGININKLGLQDVNLERVDPEFKALEKEVRTLMKAEGISIGFAFTAEGSKFDVRAAYKTEADAAAADAAMRALAAEGRKKLDEPKKQMKAMLDGKPGQTTPRPIKELPEAVLGLMGYGALNLIDEHLANPAVTVEGNELVTTFDSNSMGGAYVSVAAVGTGLLLPAMQKVRDTAVIVSSKANMKQIGLAMHNYHDTYQKLPRQSWTQGPDGGPGGLSWRVHLLPYLGQQELYNQFKLDEPWDSPNNKRLIPLMPKVYASQNAPPGVGQTYFKVFYGPGATFGPNSKITNLISITDGTSNTIMTVEGGPPVTWTKPDDIPFDPKKPLPDLKMLGNQKINVGLFDGSVVTITLSRLSPEVIVAVVTPDGEETLPPNWIDPQK